MSNTTYNGWTNYATWRVNLEVFDGFDPYEYFSDANDEFDPSELADNLKEFAEEVIFSGHHYDARGQTNLMQDYARAFLSDVNWHEIASHMIEDYAPNETEEA